MSRQDDTLRHAAAPTVNADESIGFAQVGVAALARHTCAIEENRFHGDEVSDVDSCHIGGDLRHPAGELMPEDVRPALTRHRMHVIERDGRIQEQVNVGPTNARIVDRYLHAARPKFRCRYVVKAQLLWTIKSKGTHNSPPLSTY